MQKYSANFFFINYAPPPHPTSNPSTSARDFRVDNKNTRLLSPRVRVAVCAALAPPARRAARRDAHGDVARAPIPRRRYRIMRGATPRRARRETTPPDQGRPAVRSVLLLGLARAETRRERTRRARAGGATRGRLGRRARSRVCSREVGRGGRRRRRLELLPHAPRASEAGSRETTAALSR